MPCCDPVPFRRREISKIVTLGSSGVGKTALITRYVSGEFKEMPQTTIPAVFLQKDVLIEGSLKHTLQIWDTCGQERYASLGPIYYR